MKLFLKKNCGAAELQADICGWDLSLQDSGPSLNLPDIFIASASIGQNAVTSQNFFARINLLFTMRLNKSNFDKIQSNIKTSPS